MLAVPTRRRNVRFPPIAATFDPLRSLGPFGKLAIGRASVGWDHVLVKLLATILLLAAAMAGAADATWPTMPTKFVSGRLATQEDLANGNAVFFIEAGGKQLTTPTQQFRIPQYAYLLQANGARRPVVLVQAEILDGEAVLGLRNAQGEMFIASGEEVELLGLTHP